MRKPEDSEEVLGAVIILLPVITIVGTLIAAVIHSFAGINPFVVVSYILGGIGLFASIIVATMLGDEADFSFLFQGDSTTE